VRLVDQEREPPISKASPAALGLSQEDGMGEEEVGKWCGPCRPFAPLGQPEFRADDAL
jgi:hypothetical protein